MQLKSPDSTQPQCEYGLSRHQTMATLVFYTYTDRYQQNYTLLFIRRKPTAFLFQAWLYSQVYTDGLR